MVEQKDDLYVDSDDDDEDIELPEGLAPEEKIPWPDLFVLTAGQDWDILLHRLSTGVKIGQFAQDELWNIYDMAPYDNKKPNYVREWLQEKKKRWLDLMEERLLNAKKSGLIPEESKVQVRLSTKDQLKQLGININISDANSLDGSFGENVSTGFDADFDVEHLESEDEELNA